MKKQVSLLASILFSTLLIAQTQRTTSPPKPEEKTDIVLKTNGDELTGKVTEITDSEIKFSYQGETLVYTLKKAEVIKITYASGRIEFFNKGNASDGEKEKNDTQSGLADHHNKVAILPFAFIKDNQDAGDDMGYKVQNEVFAFLSKHSVGLTILDPRTTNALLIKAGIDKSNIMAHTMDEICGVLGVEYAVDGNVSQNKGVSSTTTNDIYKSNKKDDNRKVSGYSSSISSQTYITNVTINISTDKNTSIYSKSHRGLLATTDGSYSSPMEYLLKRCPLYRK